MLRNIVLILDGVGLFGARFDFRGAVVLVAVSRFPGTYESAAMEVRCAGDLPDVDGVVTAVGDGSQAVVDRVGNGVCWCRCEVSDPPDCMVVVDWRLRGDCLIEEIEEEEEDEDHVEWWIERKCFSKFQDDLRVDLPEDHSVKYAQLCQ